MEDRLNNIDQAIARIVEVLKESPNWVEIYKNLTYEVFNETVKREGNSVKPINEMSLFKNLIAAEEHLSEARKAIVVLNNLN